MFLEISLENFKAFADRQMAKLAPITLIYGPNSAGKSSLIQSLLLMKQTVGGTVSRTSELIMKGDLVDLGTFKSVLHKHDSRRHFLMSVMYSPEWFGKTSSFNQLPLQFNGKPNDDRRITTTFQARVSPDTKKRDFSQLTDVCYETLGDTTVRFELEQQRNPSSSTKYFTAGSDQKIFQLKHVQIPNIDDFFKKAFNEKRQPSASPALQELFKRLQAGMESGKVSSIFNEMGNFVAANLLPTYGMTSRDGMNKGYNESLRIFRLLAGFVETLSHEYIQMLRNISYLGPMRVYPERLYFMAGGQKKTVGSKGEHVPAVIYQDQKRLTKEINDWFVKFEIPYRIKITDIGNDITGKIVSMSLEDKASKVTMAPSDVGFGIGQLLPIIVEGLVSSCRILVVEQPEIHLHPKLQAHIADFLIDTAGIKSSSEDLNPVVWRAKNQWIIETHSEALILRLQKRIRERKISKDDVSILYVAPSSEYGSTITNLRMDERGDFLDEWPEGFFEESFNELFSE